MHSCFEYRSYIVRTGRLGYAARPLDGEDDEIHASSLDSLIKHIDCVWDSLQNPHKRRPFWLRTMLIYGFRTICPDRLILIGKTAAVCCSALLAGTIIVQADLAPMLLDFNGDGIVTMADVEVAMMKTLHRTMTKVVEMEDGSSWEVTQEISDLPEAHLHTISRHQIRPPRLPFEVRVSQAPVPELH